MAAGGITEIWWYVPLSRVDLLINVEYASTRCKNQLVSSDVKPPGGQPLKMSPGQQLNLDAEASPPTCGADAKHKIRETDRLAFILERQGRLAIPTKKYPLDYQ